MISSCRNRCVDRIPSPSGRGLGRGGIDNGISCTLTWEQVSPIRARYFSLLRQRKVSKRKAIPEACPLRGSPALLVQTGARATRCAQTGRELTPVFTAMLGCARRVGNQNPKQHPKPATSFPFALTEYRSQSGIRRAPCLRQVYLPSCARPRIGEERKESAIADECTGVPFSLGTFSWALKRKYLARMGEIKS